MKQNPRVAIVYDRVNKFGGAERVLLTLREMYPHSVLFTSVFDQQGASWVGNWEVRTSWLQSVPFAVRHHEWFAMLMPFAFASLDLREFDLIISVTSEFAKNLCTTRQQIHICYCLTPTRYLWSHTKAYAQGPLSFFRRIAFAILRPLDRRAANRPDAYIAISNIVKQRIETYYQRRVSAVVYPATQLETNSLMPIKETYYLVVSRLVPYKKIDLAIAACKQIGCQLRIVGTGTDRSRLEKLAEGAPNIRFEGQISDEKLQTMYRGAKALLCPQEEDFGLVSVEAQSCGVPVITYKDSGMSETVIDGMTGILFTSQTIPAVMAAIRVCESRTWDRDKIRKHVQQFDQHHFAIAFARAINRVQLHHKEKGKV